jgi:hypothetical protein
MPTFRRVRAAPPSSRAAQGSAAPRLQPGHQCQVESLCAGARLTGRAGAPRRSSRCRGQGRAGALASPRAQERIRAAEAGEPVGDDAKADEPEVRRGAAGPSERRAQQDEEDAEEEEDAEDAGDESPAEDGEDGDAPSGDEDDDDEVRAGRCFRRLPLHGCGSGEPRGDAADMCVGAYPGPFDPRRCHAQAQRHRHGRRGTATARGRV